MVETNGKNKTEMTGEVSAPSTKPASAELSAFAFDRDKNVFYLASDESVDQILDADGYHVVHANRELGKK